MVDIWVPGCPVPMPRPRTLVRAGKAHTVSNPRGSRVAAYKASVALHARVAMAGKQPLVGPLWCTLLFLMPRPAGLKTPGRGWHAHAPDVDNLVKSTLDSLQSVVFKNDGQISHIEATKRVCARGEQCGVRVKIVEAES